MRNWFESCKTIEDVKQQYKKLVFEYHPDITKSDTNEIMAEINNQYSQVAQKLKNVHKNSSGETYERETPDTSEEFKNIINTIAKFKDIIIEVCGDWLWVSGSTREYKDTLKSLKFKWSPNKNAWYYHSQPYQKKSKKVKTLEEIREMFGSQKIKSEERESDKMLKIS